MRRFLELPRGLVATLLATLCVTSPNPAAASSVNVDMKAAFPAPPYLLELLETAAGENATAYFPLLDRIADGSLAGTKTDKELYERFLDIVQRDGHFSSPESLSTFKLALSLRSAAPRVEAHYQYYDTAVVPKITDQPEDCDDWVLWQGQRYCSASLSEGTSVSGEEQVRHLPFDRSLGVGKEAILYADITKPEFASFHVALSEKARKENVSYRLRYRIKHRGDIESLPVSGYGVSLQLKRTDYIVIDDREADDDADSAQDALPAEVVLDQEEHVADLKPLSSSELSSLGMKAGSFIMQSEKPLDTLIKLTQDFPKLSTSIASHEVDSDFVEEHMNNRMSLVSAGINVLWMNGVQMIERQTNPYTLVDSIRRERKLIHGVMDLGLTGNESISLLSYAGMAQSNSDDAPRRFDWRDEIEDGRVIVWLNDLEKDSRYVDYPKGVTGLMQRTMPGQIPPHRKDIFNLIVPVDFSSSKDIAVVVEMLLPLVKRGFCLRFGLVPLTPTKEAEEQAKIVYYLLENYGLSALVSFAESSMSDQETVLPDLVKFDGAIQGRSLREEATVLAFSEVLESEYYVQQIESAKHYTERLGANSPTPPIFINGLPVPRDENWARSMSIKLNGDLQMVQQGVFMGAVTNDMWIPSVFLEDASPRRNVYIYPESDNPLSVLDVNKMYLEHRELFEKSPVVEASDESVRDTWAALTLVADLTSDAGRTLLSTALEFRRNHPGIRMDIVNNPKDSSIAHEAAFALKLNEKKLLGTDEQSSFEKPAQEGTDQSTEGNFEACLTEFLKFAAIEKGTQVIILNGRKVGPIAPSASFTAEDFQSLLEFEQRARINPVYAAMEVLELSKKVSGPLAAAKLTSITALSTISDLPEGIFESAPTKRTDVFEEWDASRTMIEIGDRKSATIQFVAVVNPASEIGQKWAPILKVLSELEGVHMRIFVNPRDRLDELPVKRFYRYVMESAPSFDESGKVQSLGSIFKGLPSEALLNLGMDVPPAWLVAAKDSIHDLDNLKLSTVKADVDATYELENILIEGHSRDGSSGSAPRGVEVVLGTERDQHFADTIIMANLGYFQFKANPGYYNIQLKKGRSSDIFDLISVGSQGYAAVPGDESADIALMSFQGTTLYPRLERRAGMEKADVLAEDDSEGSDLLSRGLKLAGGLLGGITSSKSASDEEHAEINVFSVASGHLYERMLNIMMASVMSNTKHTVKFWFIEQFLSPSFKDFIPHMAAEYGFKYEMVTYKWPHWLRQQKEKQREIWGYKILFLDVLFPLSLDKVIFVDADQVVRTDLIDLVRHDLEGAPYGFTPMCDSRTEMEGFRFWKQGYWASYLRGLPYHISALYVVDLKRFRQIAAGDRLRQTYHQLSADPNSLSNLDQDLPNHMQFHIPIHSLPQDWLWCETWCSDEALSTARTIDLCNNPQTKEPKLDRARRQVPEWTKYDDEIAQLDRRIRREGLQSDAVESEKRRERDEL